MFGKISLKIIKMSLKTMRKTIFKNC